MNAASAPAAAEAAAARGRALWHMHLATLLFGLSGVFGAQVLAPAVLIVWGRALCAGLLLAAGARMQRRWPGWRAPWRETLPLLAAGVLLAAHWLTFFLAVQRGGVALGTLGFACFPALTALFEALLLRQPPARREVWLIALVTAGLVLVAPTGAAFDAAALQGLAWGVLSGALYALLAIFNRAFGARVSARRASGWQFVAIVALTTPWALTAAPQASLADWGWILAIGVLCTGIAYQVLVASLRVLAARTAALVIALEPVYAILIDWLAFGETPALRVALGGAVMVVAVLAAGRPQSGV